jgi:hypothetical protein
MQLSYYMYEYRTQKNVDICPVAIFITMSSEGFGEVPVP